MSLDYDSPYYDQREEERTEAARAYPEPPPRSVDWAVERGYDPADAAEGTY